MPSNLYREETMHRYNNPETLDILIPILKNDPSPRVKIQAALAIGEIGGEKAMKALDNAIKNDLDSNVIQASKQAKRKTEN